MEDFVPFELAKKLNKKGFNEDCYTVYNTATMRIERSLTTWKDYKGVILAPAISQVLKWLRKEKKLYIEIYMYHNCYLWEIYNTNIYDADFTQKSEKYSEIEYETYEQAALAGIEYVLDNLI